MSQTLPLAIHTAEVSTGRLLGYATRGDEVLIHLAAAVVPGVLAFASTNASVTFNSENQLTGTHGFEGKFEDGSFELRLDNGVMLAGEFVKGAAQNEAVSGICVWLLAHGEY